VVEADQGHELFHIIIIIIIIVVVVDVWHHFREGGGAVCWIRCSGSRAEGDAECCIAAAVGFLGG
jgi:hypothetical protein